MDQIKVGEYGRTNLGNIIKFAWLEKEGIIDNKKVVLVDKMKETTNCYYYFEKNEIIVKHSKSIIDLIEVGDYVNGKKVIKINCSLKVIDDDVEYGEYEINNGLDLGDEYIYFSGEIQDIVTKEQFESIAYKL